MKMILLQDVEGLGKRGELKNAAEGYARNFLLPRRLAVAATGDNQKQIDALLAADTRRRAKATKTASDLADAVSHHPVTLARPSADGAKLFGSVTVRDIAAALAEKGLTIDSRQITAAEPIRTLGHHQVTVKTGGGHTATLTVTVVAQEK